MDLRRRSSKKLQLFSRIDHFHWTRKNNIKRTGAGSGTREKHPRKRRPAHKKERKKEKEKRNPEAKQGEGGLLGGYVGEEWEQRRERATMT